MPPGVPRAFVVAVVAVVAIACALKAAAAGLKACTTPDQKTLLRPLRIGVVSSVPSRSRFREFRADSIRFRAFRGDPIFVRLRVLRGFVVAAVAIACALNAATPRLKACTTPAPKTFS